MASYRSLACKQPCGSFHHVVVIEQIVVHQIALCCIAAPHPSVALYAVNEKLACGELHCVCADFPYSVKFFIVASERSFLFFGHKLIVHAYTAYRASFCLNADKPECLAVAEHVFVSEFCCLVCSQISYYAIAYFKFVECFTVVFVRGFFLALAVVDIYRAVASYAFQYGIAESLFSEVVYVAVGSHGFMAFALKFKL